MRALPVILILAIAMPARADDELAEAKRLEVSLEYEQALAIIDRAIAHGGADPRHLAELHLFAGKLAAGLDRVAIAEDHFARVLALQPDATLPDGTSPKITTPFDAARALAKPLQITAAIAGGLVTLQTGPDPLALVAGIHVGAVDASGHPADVGDPHALRVQLPAGVTAREVTALDASGNVVWTAAAPADTAVIRAPAPPPRVVEHRPAIHARWSTWAVTSSVALAAGGVCAWRFGVAQKQWNDLNGSAAPDYATLTAIEHRGRAWGLAANISFGAAAAAGITSAILYVVHADEAPVVVTATPTSIGVGGRF